MIKETHRKNMREYKIRRQLFNILSKNNPNNIKEYDISIPEYKKIKKIIEKIKGKEDFRQSDGLFSDDEKWYLVCKATLDLSSLCDNMNNIQYNAITQCNIIFSECNISLNDKQSENNRIVKTKLYFYNCTFEKTLNLKNIIFEKTLTFNQCKFKRKIRMYSNIFLSHLVFRDCYDKQSKKITSLDLQENEFKGYFFIKNCAIEKINLWKNKFKNRCYFMDSVFGNKNNDNIKLNFSNAHFEDNAYFNNSEFYNYADFHECEFDDIACFYGVKFYKAPNFSACYFKESKAANLINVDIDKLDFKSVEKYIEDNYEDESYKNEIKEIQDEKEIFKIQNEHKLRCAKNLKDSFRVIKDVLITQNNTLEAQEWHKLELYAKEEEIAIKAKSAIDVIDCKNVSAKFLKEELYDFTEWINFVLLFIYRNTSSHHTSFLKILNFTVVMIALYASFVWWLQINNNVQFVYEFIFITAFRVIVIIAFLSYITYEGTFKLRIFRILLFLGMGCSIFLLFLFQVPEPIIIYCYILLVSFLSWIFFSEKFSSFFVLTLAYIAFFIVLIVKPQFINPFTGVFSSDKLYESQFEKSLNDLNASAIVNLASILQNDFNLHLKDQNISFTELNSAKALIVANKENLLKLSDVNSNIAKEVLGEKYTELLKIINQDKIIENIIKSTGVLYGIILLLCIFSLQKTARKNSIVPS
ncbi:TPA: pentapeptide repeat-containing protein [Campylobacter jejuni]|nr:pentapeptide repeat-containing protein [Campylobacter jejuni]HED5189546.1 pentapeptide repeat-containing protein [Campylobacter jejuni]HEF1267921.1 pentapeptide repeat-containing protein [Campylobacter jejuni]HEF1810832.1 pentapeptide repeat-containing protein [Campylobacter jejuni]HEF2202377.1 pentapeptide repeat-containing protein [Campylobacter jejuni]HEF8559520.1 pentapeptide repeat-containing protein [Campylobacter jejuni]